jgi:ABC-2 type transport system ATP-binding protein
VKSLDMAEVNCIFKTLRYHPAMIQRIRLEQLAKKYGAVNALNPTTLEIDAGQIVAVLGTNGAGKTTLLRCLSTIAGPTRGRVLINDEPLTRDRLDLRRRTVFLPDFPPFYADLTILGHLGLLMKVYECSMQGREAEVVDVLRDLDLLPLCDTLISKLSRGQAYKAALAALVLIKPDLWLIDEPFASGMDPNGISYFKKRARQAARDGSIVIYSTQLIDIAEDFSDKVCVLHKGDVRAFDSVSALSTPGVRDSSGSVLEEVLQNLRQEDL